VALTSFDHASYAAELLEQQVVPQSPVEWAYKKAGIEFWSKQREICESVQKNKLTAVQSGHGVGKSFTVSTLAAWWVDTHPPEETMVVSTAPSTRQVSVIMWEGIRAIHRKAKLRGEVQRSDRWLIDDIEVGFGRKPQDYDQYAFQGIHRKYVLVIIDEAGGIDEWLWIAALAIATGKHCRIIAIGNPEDPTSYFSKVCKPGSGWNRIKISVFDSPNFTGEKVSEDAREKLTGPDWVESMEREVGRDSPMWIAKVEGNFPDIDENSVIPLSWVVKAQERWKEWKDGGGIIPPDARHVMGCDIARKGGDRTAFAHRYGHIFTSVETQPKEDTVQTARRISGQLHEDRQDVAVVDTNGVGAGVYDTIKSYGQRAIPVNVGTRTKRRDKSGQIEFYNIRAAAMWSLREALDPDKGAGYCLPPDDKLATDLAAPRWQTMAGGKLVVEDKKDIKKRIGRSPDRGDAVVLAHWGAGTSILADDDASFDWVTSSGSDRMGYEEGAIDWAGDDEEDWRQVAAP
jgi:hypothetical protein